MRRQRLTAFRKAALGLIACGSLLVLADSASAQSDNVATDHVVQGLTNCDLGKATKNLHVLFVLDESGSLKTHDREDRRVDGTKKALEALKRLADRFGDHFDIDVAIHGFSGGIPGRDNDLPYRDENPWLTFDDFDALIDDTEAFKSRNGALYTDYRAAVGGAIQAFNKHDPGRQGCKALVWFTDGVYDSENNTALTPKEIDEITDLCRAGGLVDQLRERAVTTIAIGLSNERTADPPDLSLVKAIASGDAVTPDNPDLVLPDGRCGTRPGTGDLYEENDPNKLIEIFEGILADSLFEAGEVRPGDPAAEGGHPPLDCTPDGNTCTFDFFLGHWVDQFTAYFKLPPASGLTATVDPPGDDATPVDITMSSGLKVDVVPGVTGESQTLSWRTLTGTADQSEGVWTGVWRIRFEGPGATEAKTNVRFIEGMLGVGLDTATLDRANPDTFDTVRLELQARGETSRCNSTTYPLTLKFTSAMGTASETFQPGDDCKVPVSVLLGLLTAEGAQSAPSISFNVTPSLKPVADDQVPLLEFPTSEVVLELTDSMVVELAGGSRLDRTDETTLHGVQIDLRAAGREVGCGSTNHLPVTLDFTSDIGTASETFQPGARCLAPAEFLNQLINTGPGKDALSVTFEVAPALEVDSGFPTLKFPSRAVSIWLQDALVVELADGSSLNRAELGSFEDVGLELFLGNQRFDPPAETQVTLDFSANLGGRSVDWSETYDDDKPLVIPPGFLEEALLDGPGRDLVRFTFEVTPKLTGGADGEAGGNPTYEPSTIHVWLHDPLEVRRMDQKELDREERGSYADVEVGLLIDGQEFSDDQARVRLEFTAEVDGSTVSSSQSYPPGGPYVISSSFFDDVFDAATGSDLLLLSVSATPTVTVGGEVHPGYEPSALQFGVRAGDGFPTVRSVSATPLHDTENSTLTVVADGPNDGTGKVEILSISGLPTDLPGPLTLVETESCSVPNKQRVECTAELDASFTANRAVQLEVNLAISGDRTKEPGKIIPESVPITLKMTRPLSTASFISKLLQLLALFVAVQTLMRVLYTTRLARWEGAEAGSRWTTLPVRISSDGGVTAKDGTGLQIEAVKTNFAAELESPASSAQLDNLHFSISWWQTFIGERKGGSLVWQQRPTIRVWSTDSHCIGPEGIGWEKKQQYARGRIGLGFTRCWVLQVSDEGLGELAKEQPATGHLAVILLPAELEDFDEQLEEIRDRISDVTGRELPGLLERLASTPVEETAEPDTTDPNDPESEGETDTRRREGDWDDSTDDDDPLSGKTGSATTETDKKTDSGGWASDDDDPLT